MNDTVRLVDGPLEGRTVTVPRIDKQMTVLVEVNVAGVTIPEAGIEDPLPRGSVVRAPLTYAPVMAKDGVQSRDDLGRVAFYYVSTP